MRSLGSGALLLALSACQPPAALRTHVDPTLLPLHRASAASAEGLIGRCVSVDDQQIHLDYCTASFQDAFESFELSPDEDLPAPDQRFDLYELGLGGNVEGQGAAGQLLIAREQVTTRVRTVQRLTIREEHLEGLRNACLEARTDARVVTGVHFGCMMSVDAASLEVSALEVLEAQARTESVAVRGAPADFRATGGDAPHCEAVAPIAVEVTDLDVFCARHVLQAQVALLHQDLKTCRARQDTTTESKYDDVVTLARDIHDMSKDLREKDLALTEQRKRRESIEAQQRKLNDELDAALSDKDELKKAFREIVTSNVELSLQLMGKAAELVQCLTRCDD